MCSRELSSQEKQAIDDILSKAEEEYAQSEPYQSIQAIDRQCQNVWPDWTPPINTSPPIKITPRKSKNISPTSSHEKPSLPATFMAQSHQNDISLYNGSPKLKSIPNTSPRSGSKEQFSSPKFNKDEIKPRILATEIDFLKNEVLDLMGKISSTVKSPEMSSTAAKLMEKANKSATPKKKLGTTDSFKTDKYNETPKIQQQIEDILNDQNDESRNQQTNQQSQQTNQQSQQTNQQNQQTNQQSQQTNQQSQQTNQQSQQTNQQSQQSNQLQQQLQENIVQQKQPTQQPHEFQLPLRIRTKAQTKSAIAAVQREMKELEQENLSLRKQFKELKQSYLESEREIKQLKDALTRSEAIRQKMLSTFGQNVGSIRSDERVHKF